MKEGNPIRLYTISEISKIFSTLDMSALEILEMMVGGYFNMNQQEHMLNFYKVIYSERSLNPMAAKIVAEETDKMIIATKQLFYAMEVHKLLHFTNPDMSAVSLAMTGWRRR